MLVNTLYEHAIPFQVSGGLGAIMYGSSRELRDIDIEIYKEDCQRVQELFTGFIVEPFRHYIEEDFELWMMTLNIEGVSVDINQVEESYAFDRNGRRHHLPDNLRDTEFKYIEDIKFPVQNKKNLVDYKRLCGRDTDLIDVEEILRAHS